MTLVSILLLLLTGEYRSYAVRV